MLNDRGYLIVGGLIALAVAADFGLNHGAAVVFLVRKLLALVDYVIFWH